MTLERTQKGKGKRTTSNGTTLQAVPALPDVQAIALPMESKEKRPKMGRTKTPRTEHGTTEAQEAFCRLVAKGDQPLSECYRQSYDASKMKPSSIWNEAYKLSVSPTVAPRIAALRAEKARNASHDSARTRSFVFERLQIEAATADNAGARIRALELLGKMDNVGMFRERQEVETIDNRAATEIEQELQDKLSTLLGVNVA